MDAFDFKKAFWAQRERIPTRGLVVYHPLHAPYASIATLPTGQTCTHSASPVTDIVDGVPCMKSNTITFTSQDNVPKGTVEFTMGLWIYHNTSTTNKTLALNWGSTSSGIRLQPWSAQLYVYMEGSNWYGSSLNSRFGNRWGFLCIRNYTDKRVATLLSGGTTALNTTSTTRITLPETGLMSITGTSVTLLSAFRVYDRAISDDEMNALFHEFSPIYAA